ncbi:MAG: fructose-6-phosphate aldolase [Bacteroidales bacterium]|nr:fructose-6-phosphate aldolase [Bacteroidales bacterium]
MIYLADTANLDEIKELFKYLPMEGVTTNPSIVKSAEKPLSVIIPELQKCIGNKMLHLQIISEKAEDILREAKHYRDYFDLKENFYVKIPVTKEGYKAIAMVKEAGMNVTATAIFTQQQAFLAANAGADFVAPYVNRLDNISSHGIDVVADIVKGFNIGGIKSKVLAASFKNVDQVYRVSMVGCHAVTASYDVLMAIASHPMTDKSVEDFIKDSKKYYDVEY